MSEQTKELIRAEEIAEEANRANSSFLANITHKLRTPLTGVLEAADLLAMTNLDEKQKRHVAPLQSRQHPARYRQ